MLPFLKDRDAALAGDDDPVERKHDDDFDTLSACAEDILSAVERKDAAMLKAALGAFADHIRDMDIQQDAKG